MSFGFAVSDVLDLANNCHKLYRGIKETPSNLASVRESLNNLTDVLAQVQESMNERHPESDIRGNEKKSQALDSALSSCADSLKKFEVILKKYAVMEQKRPRKRDRLFSRSGLMFTLIEAKAIPGIQQELMVHLQVLGSLQHYFHG